MNKAKMREKYAGQYEVHCVVCGAQIGFFNKGEAGEGLTCGRCKRPLSFIVQDGVTVVRCQQQK